MSQKTPKNEEEKKNVEAAAAAKKVRTLQRSNALIL